MGWESNTVCLPKSFQRPPAQKGPHERAPRVSTASVYMFFSPVCLLCSVPPAATNTFTSYIFSKAFPLWFLSYFSFSVFPLSLSLSQPLLMNLNDIDFPTTELQLNSDYREKGFTFPRNQIYPTHSVLGCLATKPSFSFLTLCFLKEGAQPKAACSCSSKPAKADFPHFLCGCGVLQWTCHNLTFTPNVKAFKARRG